MRKSFLLFAKITPIIILLLLCFPVSGQQKCKETISEEEVKALAEGILKIWNEGNMALVEEHCDPNFVIHHCGFPEDLVGLEAFKGWVTSSRTSFPDFAITFDKVILKGDMITLRWTVTGTNTGPLGELPATGKKFRISGLSLVRVADKKVAEEWIYYNLLDMYQQLGFTLVPPQP